MMNELKEVKKAVKPTEVLLVVDAMTGQEAAGLQLLVVLRVLQISRPNILYFPEQILQLVLSGEAQKKKKFILPLL